MNLAGVLAPDRYDALVDPPWRRAAVLPGARAVVVLATGGPAFFRCFRQARERQARPAVGSEHPLDDYLVRVVRAAVERERSAGHAAEAGFYFERRGGHFADFVALGRESGLGADSRLAVLVHPVFGPWLALRALLFTERPLAPTVPDPDFAPCAGCPAPCESACPGAAVAAEGFDVDACQSTSRRVAACRIGCDARRACVIGPTHRYDADAEAWHRRAARAMQAP